MDHGWLKGTQYSPHFSDRPPRHELQLLTGRMNIMFMFGVKLLEFQDYR
jgi:hypothetical protein